MTSCGRHISITPVTSFESLGAEWRRLEALSGRHSFFQSWTWIGCGAEERYPDPVLLRLEEGGAVSGLALFNRRRGRLHLAASGDPVADSPYVEHNGPLLADMVRGDASGALMRDAWRVTGARRIVLAGVRAEVMAAAEGVPLSVREVAAPRVELGPIRAAGRGYLSSVSANTRYQLRRSQRCLQASGELRLAAAANLDEALAWLSAMIGLHERRWRERGMPGSFATPFARRFHEALVARALERGELDLLRFAAGNRTCGYLYNFRLRGHVYAYQSGFDLDLAGPHGKPGLTCHHIAIERALSVGDEVYDFLAGPARYKLSLSNASIPLFWGELLSRRSGLGRAVGLLRALRCGWRGAAGPSGTAKVASPLHLTEVARM